MKEPLQVWSEVGLLKKLILHRPGEELLNLTPRYLNELLFDEIPWLAKARAEHDNFAGVLQKQGIEVYYVNQLLSDILEDAGIRSELIKKQLCGLLEKAGMTGAADPVYSFLYEMEPDQLASTLIAGLRKSEIKHLKKHITFGDLTVDSYPFYLAPLPNMYFTRDHGVMMGKKLQISTMFLPARRRETSLIRFICRYHPLFEGVELTSRKEIPFGIEGGDVMILNQDSLMIGHSERTTEEAIEWVAHNYLVEKELFKQIVVVQIPSRRAYMHLDTVFTAVDRDKFLLYPGVKDDIYVYWLERGGKGRVSVSGGLSLQGALCKALGLKQVEIICPSAEDEITAAREQWNDSNNTLAVKPGTVICYDRNETTNKTLRKHGLDVIEIDGSELVRGRGGPRCMSLPLEREKI